MTAVSPHLDDIRPLLEDGLTNPQIAARLDISRQAVWRVRKHLGIPDRPPPNPPAAATLEAAFYQRTRITADSHLEWTGIRNVSGVAVFTHAKKSHSAGRVAFRIANGRDADGTVKPECGKRGCVAPACVEDASGRARARAAVRRILLELPALTGPCRNGHDRAKYSRLEADGYARCTACADQRRTEAAA